MYELRDYQKKAVSAGLSFLNDSKKDGGIIVMPTGSGKSLVIAKIANELSGNTLVLQPSLEILESNYSKMISYVDESEVGIFSASAGVKEIKKITYATIGSIINCKERFGNFSHLIVDECHLCNAKGGMYEELIQFFGGRVLGLTATPFRMHTYADFKTGEKCVVAKFLHRTRPRLFSKIIHITQLQELYKDKFLCPISYEVNYGYNQLQIKLNTTGLDFDQKALKRYNREKGIINIVKKVIERSEAKHILVFTISVEEAVELDDMLTVIGIRSATVSAKTPKKERAEILEKFKSGEIRVVTNVSCLTTGYDFPALDCVIIARPTQSVALFYQMMGRGIRIAEGKEKLKMIDICGNVPKFGRIEKFEFVEEKEGMHRLKSDTKFLTGYDFFSNEDLEIKNYKGKRESSWNEASQIIMFGKHKGTHVSKVPNNYLNWIIEKFDDGNVRRMFQAEKLRRKGPEKKTNDELPF